MGNYQKKARELLDLTISDNHFICICHIDFLAQL